MARPEKLLTARGAAALTAPGRYADGGGLYLDVDDAGRRRWIWRHRFAGKRRDMGLGAAASVTLAKAREERDHWRAELAKGVDPIAARARRERETIAAAVTFGQVADDFVTAHWASWRNPKHRDQWKMTLEVYAAPLRSKPVGEVATADILDVLKPIWATIPETARRLRGRIEKVLDAARALGHIEEGRANPARWKGHLDHLLAKRGRRGRRHFKAMPFKDAPAFVAGLRAENRVSARAMEFMILTAGRTNEVLGGLRGEIDEAAKLWTIPADRMKAGREHRVPLCERALAILAEVRAAYPKSKYLFPGQRPGRPLSNMTFLMRLRRAGIEATGHGFRSAFSDWRGDATNFPKELAELALAHAIEDETEAAYRRSDALDRRRDLMDAWSRFLEGGPGAQVILLSSKTRRRTQL